jgi:hypothetical protein
VQTVDRRQHDDRWVIKKEFSLGDGIAIIVAFVSLVSVYYRVDNRLVILETDKAERRVYVDRLEDKIDRKFLLIDGKLDRLLEAVVVTNGAVHNGNGRK